MRILGTGIDYSTGDPLIEPLDEEAFGEAIGASLERNAREIERAAAGRSRGRAFRGEVQRARTVDLGNPREAGWTYLVNRSDPRRQEIEGALAALARHRQMSDPGPLLFDGGDPGDWQAWIQEHYLGRQLTGASVPHYVLIAGSPDQVPFHFQSLLDSAASVGRVDFESPADLEAYVDKLLRIEQGPAPLTRRETLFFATDGGPSDATHYSRRFMADPLAEHVATRCRIPVRALTLEDATKEQLLEDARTRRPALVYTATHGMAAPREPLDVQRRVNGALCCQRFAGDPRESWLLTADDVTPGDPFFEGSIVFQFACFGYGTPAESDFEHWLGGGRVMSAASFVASLPRRLLAHPRGPIAFIGHVDTAWLHGFRDPDDPRVTARWSARITPYRQTVDCVLTCQPVGLAMTEMNRRFDLANAELTLTIDRLLRRRLELTPEVHQKLASTFIFRSDAQNYLVFGDPAAHARIPDA